MRFRNSFNQWLADFSVTVSVVSSSFAELYPDTLLGFMSATGIYHGHRPDAKRLNTTVAEIALQLFGDKLGYTLPAVYSVSIPKANPDRHVVWSKPHGAFFENGRVGSIVDVIAPVYVEEVYIGGLSAAFDSTQIVELLEGSALPEGSISFIVEVQTATIVAAPFDAFDRIFCPSLLCDPETQTFNDSRLDRSTEYTILPSLFEANPIIQSLWNSTLSEEISQTSGILRYIYHGNRTTAYDEEPTELIVSWATIEFGSSNNWVLVHVLEAHLVEDAAVWSLSESLVTIEEGFSGSLSFTVSNLGTENVTWQIESNIAPGAISVSPTSGMLLSGEERVISFEFTSEWSDNPTPDKAGAVIRLVPNPLIGSSSCFDVLSLSVSGVRGSSSSGLSQSQVLWVTITPSIIFLLTCFGGFFFFRIQSANAEAKRSHALLQQEQDFVAFTFHELRTPLSGAAGFLEYALENVGELVKASKMNSTSNSISQREVDKPSPSQESIDARTNGSDPNRLKTTTSGPATGPSLSIGSQASGTSSEPPTLLQQAHSDLIRANHCYNHTLDILNHVLDMAKLARNELSLDEEPFDIQETCFMACVMQNVGNPNVGLRVLVQDGIPAVRGDAKRLKQVCLNLLSNALSSTHFGYVILQCEVVKREVRVPVFEGRQSGGEEKDDGTTDEDHGFITLRFSLYDTGTGIAADMQHKVFSQYECLDRKVGTGLGLSVCSKLVELMGGTVQVKSPFPVQETLAQMAKPINEPSALHSRGHGAGSCFWFEVTFPLAESEHCNKPNSNSDLLMAQLFYTSENRDSSMEKPQLDSTEEEEKCDEIPSSSSAHQKERDGIEVDANSMSSTAAPTLDLVSGNASSGKFTSKEDSEPHIELLVLREVSLAIDFPTLTQKWQILIVDDVKLNRQLLRRRFERVEPFKSARWECHEAVNGEAALEIMSKTDFNLVTMDENMSLTSGILTGTETVKEFRAREKLASRTNKSVKKHKCIIIAVSGNVATRDRTRYLDAGMDAVWGKPLPNGNQMVGDIMSCIEQKNQS